MYQKQGFTLIEILVVLAIISILAMLALPSQEGKVERVQIAETLKLVEQYKPDIEAFYRINGAFPTDNAAAGMPDKNKITGNYLASTTLENGAMHLVLGNKIRESLRGKIISVRPIFVPGERTAPVSWICGYDSPPLNMLAAGGNQSTVTANLLPSQCR